jgi:preprotein translocase subunit SecE
MHKIEYEIKLNDVGRPCIELSEDYENRPEDRFFVIEITRYIILDLLKRRKPDLDADTVDTMKTCEAFLGQIGDEVAKILWHQMKGMGEIDMMFNKIYHFTLETVEELDKIGNYILSNNKIFKKENGLKVFIIENTTVYVYNDDNWTIANES